MHRCIRHTSISTGQIKKKKKKNEQQSTNIKCDEIILMNIMNDNT